MKQVLVVGTLRGEIFVYDLETAKVFKSVRSKSPVNAVAVSGNGKFVGGYF